MSFGIAVIIVLLVIAALCVVVWYVDCLIEIFYRCEKPNDFFCGAYDAVPFFVIVTFMIVVSGLAKILQWVAG